MLLFKGAAVLTVWIAVKAVAIPLNKVLINGDRNMTKFADSSKLKSHIKLDQVRQMGPTAMVHLYK